MKKKITVLSGDGIGPEVVAQALKVLDAVADRFDHYFEYCHAEMGAGAIDRYGDPLPPETLDACLRADAVLLGAIGDPKYDNDPGAKVRPEQGLLRLRQELGLFANIRPVATFDSLLHLSPLREDRVRGVDFVIFRELTGGIYFGEKGRSDDKAFDTCAYRADEIERIAHLAFRQARQRRRKVTLVDKANVLETSRLWRECVQNLAGEYPDVTLETMFVDNAAMQLIQYPGQFDVVLTSNMFGDILSDEASVLLGSMGLLPSASIGERTSLFEPIHGSYPQAAGKDIANPMATILSAAMLIESFDMHTEATAIRHSVRFLLEKGMGTPELEPEIPAGCRQLGDLVAHLVGEEDILHIQKDKISERLSTII